MCGVAAICAVEPMPQSEAMPRLAAGIGSLRHRGPDGSGHWLSPCGHAVLGHTRLAIVDPLDRSSQPMLGERFVLSFNGEIYNAPDLRRALLAERCSFSTTSDTEVLLVAIERLGFERAIDAARGMFAVIAWDRSERTLWAATDHAGMKPLAYREDAAGLTLASDCDALRAMLHEQPALDIESMALMLQIGSIPAPRTIWQGVRKLGPGELLSWRPGERASVHRWWQPPSAIDPDSPRQWLDDAWPAIAGEHLLADVPLGLFLSGGIDSTAVACALPTNGHRPTALTLAMAGAHDESPVAAATAADLGLAHERIDFGSLDLDALLLRAARAYDEPQAYGALLTMVAIAEAARTHRKAVLAGDGGDEAFAGYAWHGYEHRQTKAPTPIDLGPDVPASDRHAALRSLAGSHELLGYQSAVFPRWHPLELAHLLSPTSLGFDERVPLAILEEADEPSLPAPRRWQRLDLRLFCASSILPKVDRGSMAVGLEVRTPLLDRRVLEWALARPVAEEPGSKAPLRRWLAGRVRPDALSRPKQGFSLRIDGDAPWTSRLGMIDRSTLASMLHPSWRSFVTPDAPFAEARAYGLCMLAAWLSERVA